jgi:uncharacterized membrane protein YhaH (DUF805 family)
MPWQQLFFSFGGRINRARYWLAVLIYVVFGAVVAGIGVALTGTIEPREISPVWLIPAAALYIVLVVSGLAVAVKRLHDRDKSGWWVLLFYLVPGILSGVGNATGNPAIAILFGLGALIISIWAFIEFGCLRGTIGSNRFGPDPLEGQY